MTWAREKKWKESYDTTTTTTKNFWLIKENSDAEFAKNHLKLYNVFWPIWILILKKDLKPLCQCAFIKACLSAARPLHAHRTIKRKNPWQEIDFLDIV